MVETVDFYRPIIFGCHMDNTQDASSYTVKVSRDQMRAIQESIRQGGSLSKVARTFNISKSYVRNIRDMDLDKSKPRNLLLPDQVRSIRKELSEGKRGIEIARDYSISCSTVTMIKQGKVWGNIV